MSWCNSLVTGIEVIDDQHQVLFDCLRELESALGTERSWSALHYALVKLADYVKVHFAVEEALMQLHDYPLFNAHVEEHRMFAKRLNELQTTSLSSDVTDEAVIFLSKWLTFHIGKSDHQYVPHLRTAPVVIDKAVMKVASA